MMGNFITSDKDVDLYIGYAKETINKFQVKIDGLERELSKTNLDLRAETQLLARLVAEKALRAEKALQTEEPQ